MKKYWKKFFLRGLIFGGGGPLVLGVVYGILHGTVENFSLTGLDVCKAVFSVYLLAFCHAGASVIPQIEHWSAAKAAFVHFAVLYTAYAGCYLFNDWLAFGWEAFLIFTAVFGAVFVSIWLGVVLSLRAAEKKLNRSLRNRF